MSEDRIVYLTAMGSLLQTVDNTCIVEQERPSASIDLDKMERMLIPLLNEVRKAQGKKPIILPK